MISLTNAVLDGYAAEIVALGPLDCWGRLIIHRQGDKGSFRFHAYRLGDGRTVLSIEKLEQICSSFETALDWMVSWVEWQDDGEPARRGELFASNPDQIREALNILRSWADERMMDDDKHPGVNFLWSIWEGWGVHGEVSKEWPD